MPDQKIKIEEEDDKWRVKMEEQSKTEEEQSQPSINLDLGIGGPTTSSSISEYHHTLRNKKTKPFFTGRVVKVEEDNGDQVVVEVEREKQRSRKCSVVYFTGEQLEEFKTQLIIFKYIVSGLPIPLQLIWRCFSSSSSYFISPLYSDLLRRYSFFLGFSSWSLNNRHSMDPEPWRCRRTDGKKWRCHKPTIPNEKYCERHMHRGSKRSRKLVESSTQSSLNPGTLGLMNPNPKSNPSNDLKIRSFQSNLNQEPHDSTLKRPTRVVIKAPGLRNLAKSNEKNELKNTVNDKSIMKERITAMSLSSGLDSSLKSVLQDGQKYPQVETSKIDTNAESGRCRRTDGKRWRCRKSVLPNQKYCAHHVNRGVKRLSVTLSTSGVNISSQEQGKSSMDPYTGVNVSLSISSGDPKRNIPEDSVAHIGESGSTSETTITDDSADISDMIVLSP